MGNTGFGATVDCDVSIPLQVFCYQHQFPKGMLLRWFNILYDLEIVEEEAFLRWKEDVNDQYPGKGKALFQVRVARPSPDTTGPRSALTLPTPEAVHCATTSTPARARRCSR